MKQSALFCTLRRYMAAGVMMAGAALPFGTPAGAALPDARELNTHELDAYGSGASGMALRSAPLGVPQVQLKVSRPLQGAGSDLASVEMFGGLRHGGLYALPAQAFIQTPQGPVVRVAQWGQSSPSPIRQFFSALFGGGQRQEDPNRTRILITPQAPSSAPVVKDTTSPRAGSTAYCVRSCDGRFFPLGTRVNSANSFAGQARCQSMCPGSDMQLFTSAGSIERAVNSSGVPYAATATAFVFRKRLVDGCTCNGSQTAGLTHVDIKDDPTLKAGDVVMTKDGPRIFTGRRGGPPYQDSDFVPPSEFPRLSKEMRQRLKELSVAATGRSGQSEQ